MGDNESGANSNESPRMEVEVVRACDEKKEQYVGRRAMEMKVQGRRKT